MFRKESDFEAFERVMVEARLRQSIRILSYRGLLSHWPVERPATGTARVNAPLTSKELDRVWVSIETGRPYGEEKWGAGNGKRTRPGADRSSERAAKENEPIGDRGNNLSTRILSNDRFHRQTNRVPVSVLNLFRSEA